MRVLVLAGGVGGAKLVWGLAQLVSPEHLTVVGNTGDDLQHLGLTICPDLDTLMYTLAGVVNPATGWGLANDTFVGLEMLARYGRPTWFRLGDRDLATHLARSELLADGLRLTEVTRHLGRSLGLDLALLPMTDALAPTLVETPEGTLDFQEWFVHRRWQPAVRRVVLPDPPPPPSPELQAALAAADLVVIAPSNPLVSVTPILNVASVRDLLRERPVLAVSPIIGGQAVKGPAAKMMNELDLEVSPVGVARFYGAELLAGLVLDQADAHLAPAVETLGIAALPAATWMRTDEDRIALAQVVLDWGVRMVGNRD